MKKKILVLMLSAMTCFSTIGVGASPVFASDLVDSTASSKDDESVGEDVSQGVSTKYETLDEIKSTTYSTTESTTIYATKSSYVVVTIPRVLVLGRDSSDKSTYTGTFNVKVEGDIAGSQSVTITPTVSNDFTEINGKDSETETNVLVNGKNSVTIDANELLDGNEYITTGSITIKNVTAGQWKGQIDFDISVNND